MASAFDHKSLQWLRSRFESGDVPTGYDFARLIDSCHNSLAHTDSIITGSLTVSGDITCLGSLSGIQTVVTNDPRVDSLLTTVSSNSGNWNTTPVVPLEASLSYLHEQFDVGSSPTAESFRQFIDSSHNSLAHNNTHISNILTTVQDNSAGWGTGTGVVTADSVDVELRSFILATSAGWGEQTDITSIVTTVSTNSASWMSGTSTSLEDVYSTVSSNSAGWSLHLGQIPELLSVVSTNSAGWEDTEALIDHLHWHDHQMESLETIVEANSSRWVSNNNEIDALTTYVQSNTANWLTQTNTSALAADLNTLTTYVESKSGEWETQTDVSGLASSIADITSHVQTNSASWAGPGDLSSIENNISSLTTYVQTNTANWLAQTDVTGLTTHVQDNSAQWAEQTDVTGLTTHVQTNSAQWAEQTDVTSLTTDVSDLTTYVQSNTANWLTQTDVTDITTLLSTNSASWGEQTDITAVTSDIDTLTTHVQTNSAQWSEQTSVTSLTASISVLTTHVQTNSAQWAEQTDVTSLTTDVSDLTTYVQNNTANWLTQTDVTNITSLLSANSAQWAEQTDVTSLTIDVSDLTTYVQTNTANWLAQTDVTALSTNIGDLSTHVLTYSSDWTNPPDIVDLTDSVNDILLSNIQLDQDVSDVVTLISNNSGNWDNRNSVNSVLSVVSANSAYWSEHTDVSTITGDILDLYDQVALLAAPTSDSISDIISLVNTYSASWGEQTDVSGLITLLADNSASWGIDTTDTALRAVVQSNSSTWDGNSQLLDHLHYHQHDLEDLETLVSSRSAIWETTGGGSGTDTTLTTFVQSNSASWGTDTTDTDLRTFVQNQSAGWNIDTDTTDTELRSIVSANSAGWAATNTIDQSLLSVVSANSAGWEATEALAEHLHWHDHELEELETFVTQNSAGWQTTVDVSNLTTHVQINSAQWGTQTDVAPLSTNISDLTTYVQDSSASWIEQTDVTSLSTNISDLTTYVQDNSAGWNAQTDVTSLTATVDTLNTYVQDSSAGWNAQTDVTSLTTDVDTLNTYVQDNSAGWNAQTDVTSLTATVDTLNTYVQDSSAGWEAQTDITSLTATVDTLNTYVQDNSAGWNAQTDVTSLTADVDDLTTYVQSNTGSWNQTIPNWVLTGIEGNGDSITSLTTLVRSNSSTTWTAQTDVTSLTADVDTLTTYVQDNSAGWNAQTDVASLTADVDTLTTYVQDSSAGWNAQTDVTSLTADVDTLTTYVQDNSAGWEAQTDVTSLTADVDTLTTYVQDNTGAWLETTDVSSLTADLDDLTVHVRTQSGTWSSGGGSGGSTPGTQVGPGGGLGSLEVISHHVDNFYTVLPDEIVSYDASTHQEIILRLFIVDCSGDTNFLYRNVHTDLTSNPYFIWFDDTTDGDYTSTDNGGQLLTHNLRWYIENDRARWNGGSGGGGTIEHAVSANWESTYSTVSSNSANWGDHTDVTSLLSTVSSNSASWSETTSTTSSGGSVGAFITQITCGDNNNVDNGIVEPLYDIDEVPVDSKRPLVSALVDTSDVRFFLQWEGPADEWTGTPTVSGHEVPRADTTAIGGNYARRFEGYIDLDLAAYTGSTITIDYNYQGLDKSIDLEIAGGGPEIMNFEFISTPSHGQDHYKDGDTIEFVVMFNTTDVISYSLQGANDTASKAYTNENVTMNGVSATITAECDTTVTSITDLPVRIKAKNALGTETPDWYESVPTVSVLNGPVITNVTFGAYPGTQTELKDGDTVPVTFEFDTNNVNRVETSGNGNNSYSSGGDPNALTVTTASYSATTTMTVDTSLENNTGGEDRPIRARARHSSQQFGNQHDSVEELTVNNQKPTFSAASITYPSNQEAIKTSETATVNIVVSNEGDTAQATYTYTGNGRNELSIPDTSTYSADKVVTYANGTYNINSANYKLEVTRQENDNTASKTATVFIADALPTIDITTNGGTDMRSGGEDGTTMQNYNVVMNSDQRLIEQPSIVAPVGTLASGFSYSANSTQFTTTIGIHDNNTRGTHTYTTLSTKNLAGQTQNTINSGSDYTIRGFVLRTLTVASQGWQVQANVAAVNYNKVEIDWEKKALTTQANLGDTTRPQSNTWSLDRLDPAPITVNILDSGATIASSNATSLTIEEKL